MAWVGSTQSALLPAPRTWSRGDDPRVTPKPQYKVAWQSAEALLQFSIDVYGAHRPEGLGHNLRVTNFRPAVFNEPIAAAVQHLHAEVDDDDGNVASYTARATNLASELLATSVRPGGRPPDRNQLGYHGAQSGGNNPPTRQHRAAVEFKSPSSSSAIALNSNSSSSSSSGTRMNSNSYELELEKLTSICRELELE